MIKNIITKSGWLKLYKNKFFKKSANANKQLKPVTHTNVFYMLYGQRSFVHICMAKERENNYLHIIVLYVVCTKVISSYLYRIRKRKITTCIGLLLVFFLSLSLSLDFWGMNYEEFICVKLPLSLFNFFFPFIVNQLLFYKFRKKIITITLYFNKNNHRPLEIQDISH